MEAFTAILELDPTLLRGLRHALAAWLEGAGAETSDRDAMVLATHEATAQAMQTAEAGSTIDVVASRDLDHRFVVDVQSEGAWATISADVRGGALALAAQLVSVSARSRSHSADTHEQLVPGKHS